MTKSIPITALIAIMTISITLFFVGTSTSAEITHEAKVVSGTMESMVDPGVGHESHQLAILLPPSENVYSGTLTYSASEPIQLVALHGPLAEGEDNGQPIWTPDGETKFALTFVDNEASMGTWKFSGNALAVHTMNTDPFTVSYSVTAMQKEASETVMSGTMESMVDPGVGHESHQLAILLPPSENVYSGTLTYSASEPIQLVALHGPLAEGEDNGQPIWTPDGETKFALTFVDNEASMGTWKFSGNALAVHTMNTDPFTVSYSVTAMQKEASETVMSGTMESMVDPGVGHESHQLAILLPPSENVYSGTLTYSASEPIQLVALHGPLAEGEDNGQPIWTPDGETKFALTFVDNEASMGTWKFSGNALAVHTMNTDPFTVSYSVTAMQKEASETVMSGTMESMVDPGVGHESHQLAILLPPSENVYSGTLTYSASEPIQLVALHGPLAEGEDNGQPIWTPDGETKFALTFVDNEASMGTWKFSGNALAVHTMNTDPFTVSYSVTASATGGDIIYLEEEVMMYDDSTVGETMDDDSTVGETMDDDSTVGETMDDDSTVGETMDDDSMMDETVMRPLQQMKSGVDPQDVVCKEGLVLMLRTSDGSATCVTESSSTRLLDMGWGSLG